MTKHTPIAALVCGMFMLPATVQAQPVPPSVSPGAIQSQERAQREQQQREERLQQGSRTPAVTAPGAAPASPGNDVKNIRVERIEVDASAILSAAEVEAILAPLRGQTVSLNDLQAAVAQINRLYETRRQLTARAFLPPQTIRDGVVRIRLVESRTGAVRIQGNRALAGDYVRDRLTLSQDKLMSIPTLEEDIARFNRLNETQLRASVVAGEKFGTTDVEITVVEPARHRFSAFTDNGGRDTTGNARAGFTYRFSNPRGISDSMQFTGSFTEGSQSLGLTYSMPLARSDIRFDTSLSYGKIKIIDGPFEPLDITGSSSDVTFGLTKPLLTTAERSWSTYARLSLRESISEFGSFPQMNEDLSVLTLGLAGDRLGDKRAWYLDQQVVIGNKGLGGESDFLYYRASANRQDQLGESFQLVSRAGLQLSDTRVLPSSELFQIGGAYTVRGYSEGLLSGRNGYYLSMEMRWRPGARAYLEQSPNAPVIQWLAFLDHGGALPYRPGNLPESTGDDYITGAGFGLMFDWRRTSGRLVVAAPLDKNPAEANYDRARVHAYLSIALD